MYIEIQGDRMCCAVQGFRGSGAWCGFEPILKGACLMPVIAKCQSFEKKNSHTARTSTALPPCLFSATTHLCSFTETTKYTLIIIST